jgi:hypothetical protein
MYRLSTCTLHFEFAGSITCTTRNISVVFDSVSFEIQQARSGCAADG